MASFFKFEDFIRAVFEGEHNLDGTDTLKLYLTNATPSASLDAAKADLAEISIENGYTGAVDIENGGSESSGTYTITATDKTVTASGGTVGPFRYVGIYNEDHASDGLVCAYDYGSEITLASGESFLVDFGASLATAA